MFAMCANLVACNEKEPEASKPKNDDSDSPSNKNDQTDRDDADDKDDKNDKEDDEENNEENNDENTDDDYTPPAVNPGSGTISKPTGSTQIPTPGTSDPSEEGAPAVNEFDVASYDLKKYLYPIWKTDISYAENTFVCEYTQNSNLEFQLLYPITEIISVRSADLKTLYKEGVDYQVVNGNLKVLKTGSIPTLKYSEYYRDAASYEAGFLDVKNNNKAFFYDEVGGPGDPGMSRYGISVTYRHTAASTITTPVSKAAKFSNLINKINAGQDIQIVSLGDSITDGWSSSSQVNMLPGCPSYHNMVTDYIRSAYGVNVKNENLAYSGKTSAWALSTCSDRGYVPIDKVCTYNPDLVILAFGMNDGGSVGTSQFLSNINSMLNTINNNCPNACVIVVGTQLPNPQACWRSGSKILNYHDDYSGTLLAAESGWSNAAYADVTKTHMEMIHTTGDNPNIVKLNGRKTYEDTAGSNSNHPNDYFHRVYAQVVIQTIFGGFKLS